MITSTRRKAIRLATILNMLVLCCQSFTFAFVPSSFCAPRWDLSVNSITHTAYRSRVMKLFLNLDSNDPFEVLELQATPDLEKKDIKRAYKRMAIKYHPDVITNQSSTPEEKKKANDDFAKINWAYATLSGKNQDDKSTSTSTRTTSTSTAGRYTPPHRRTSSYSPSNVSTDWKDYMPKYSEEDYATGGDSLGSIFSDLLSGVAGAAASGGIGGASIFRDFIEFLEGNDMAGGNDDANLFTLLQTENFQDIANEMDDTDLVVQQLSSKLSNVEEELIMCKADLKATTRYIEKLNFEEKVDELEARKKVVQGYLKKARKRLLTIQTRYKELIIGGKDDSRTRGKSDESSSKGDPDASYSRSTSSSSSSTNGQSSSNDSAVEEDAWKNQSFGSTGRRGSGRKRRSPVSTERTSPAESDARTMKTPPPPRQEPSISTPQKSSTTLQSGSQPTSNSAWVPPVPPHRRTTASSQAQDDKRRMRELQVDDEFEKLKKELGL